VIAVAALAGPLATPGRAVNGAPATFSTSQVRLYRNSRLLGGGTLVDRNWVLTASLGTANPADYTFRFGVVDNANDQDSDANEREIDRIVRPPGGGGVAMLHFTIPVPENMVTRRLATRPPDRLTPVFAFGWGTPEETNDGTTLRIAATVAYDPVAQRNAAHLRTNDLGFIASFPEGIQPMAINLLTSRRDLGSGSFAPNGTLLGVDSVSADYHSVNEEGNLYGGARETTYEQPVWAYRQWILDTINGAGSSGSTPSPPPSGRSLTETPGTETPPPGAGTTGDLPMTLPPQTGLCPATGSCVDSDPGWKAGVLLGAGNYRGTALARCATATGNTCSFDDVPTPPGASARLPLGPASAPTAPGTRQVMAWCKTTTPFPDTSSAFPQTVLRISLTNADPSEVQPGYGWWDVTPGQVGTGHSANGQLDTTTLPAC
jgi:hypothetical protein